MTVEGSDLDPGGEPSGPVHDIDSKLHIPVIRLANTGRQPQQDVADVLEERRRDSGRLGQTDKGIPIPEGATIPDEVLDHIEIVAGLYIRDMVGHLYRQMKLEQRQWFCSEIPSSVDEPMGPYQRIMVARRLLEEFRLKAINSEDDSSLFGIASVVDLKKILFTVRLRHVLKPADSDTVSGNGSTSDHEQANSELLEALQWMDDANNQPGGVDMPAIKQDAQIIWDYVGAPIGFLAQRGLLAPEDVDRLLEGARKDFPPPDSDERMSIVNRARELDPLAVAAATMDFNEQYPDEVDDDSSDDDDDSDDDWDDDDEDDAKSEKPAGESSQVRLMDMAPDESFHPQSGYGIPDPEPTDDDSSGSSEDRLSSGVYKDAAAALEPHIDLEPRVSKPPVPPKPPERLTGKKASAEPPLADLTKSGDDLRNTLVGMPAPPREESGERSVVVLHGRRSPTAKVRTDDESVPPRPLPDLSSLEASQDKRKDEPLPGPITSRFNRDQLVERYSDRHSALSQEPSPPPAPEPPKPSWLKRIGRGLGYLLFALAFLVLVAYAVIDIFVGDVPSRMPNEVSVASVTSLLTPPPPPPARKVIPIGEQPLVMTTGAQILWVRDVWQFALPMRNQTGVEITLKDDQIRFELVFEQDRLETAPRFIGFNSERDKDGKILVHVTLRVPMDFDDRQVQFLPYIIDE